MRFFTILLVLVLNCRDLLIAAEERSLPRPNLPENQLHHGIPTYYIDPHLLKLSQGRYQQCGLHYGNKNGEEYNNFAFQELQYLYFQHSASEYFRGHELLSYQYFVEYRHQNPFFRENRQDAALEYIPILTLHWKQSSSSCNYSSFIQYLWTMWKHIQQRDNVNTADVLAGKVEVSGSRTGAASSEPYNNNPIKFFVSSTFNMRTEWGKGMSSPHRKGDEYENISAFVMSLSVGHYERWPECPDLLRKWWKYVVELPYLDSSPSALQRYDFSSYDTNPLIVRNADGKNFIKTSNNRKINFLFAGSFELPGPERVCSVRNSLLSLASRDDTILVNVSLTDSQTKGVSRVITTLIEKSNFCIITSGQSYSTSFFYHAIQHDCIPIVIDDWFTFSFPWLIHYELFVIRLNEEDFKANPNAVLDYVLKRYKGLSDDKSVDDDAVGSIDSTNTDGSPPARGYQHMRILDLMRLEMRKAKQLLSFETYSYPHSPPGKDDAVKHYRSVPVFEHMMLELVYAQEPHNYFNNIPCYRYYMCKPYTPKQLVTIQGNSSVSSPREYLFIDNKNDKFKFLSSVYADVHPEQVMVYNNIFHADRRKSVQLHNDGYQASALFIPEKFLRETRSHLCRNSKRLIGMYKMVYFMQCVRVLWPLHPGKFRNADNEARFSKSNYDASNDNGPGIQKDDRDFVLAFHNIAHQELIGGSWANVVMYPWNNTATPFIKSLRDAETFYLRGE